MSPPKHTKSTVIHSKHKSESRQAQSVKNQHHYTQDAPWYVCRQARRFHEISEIKGFRCKCREPRCSIECHRNAAKKLMLVMSRHLYDLPKNLSIYRGNMSLPPDAGPDIHLEVRERFLENLRKWKTRHGYIVEIYARTHATDPLNAHYDIVVYTDCPHDLIHATMIRLWENAGGRQRNKNARGMTLVPLEEHELMLWAHYLVKMPRPVRAGELQSNTILGQETAPLPKLLRIKELS